MTFIYATIALAFALFGVNAMAAEPGRPGVFRLGSVCFNQTPDHEVPCDDRTADAELMAGQEWTVNDLIRQGHPLGKIYLEAWQAAKGDTFAEKVPLWEQEMRKQAQRLGGDAKPFISGACLPDLPDKPRDEAACERKRDDFRLEYWAAMQGNKLSQENVAECFEGTFGKHNICLGVVPTNYIMVCAWRLVMISSGSPKVTRNDVDRYDDECSGRPWSEKQASFGQATELFQRIYNRPLPVAK